MINCAIIGYGKMGKIRAKALEDTGRARVVGVFDAEKIEDEKYHIYSMDTEAIEDLKVDAVFVCTPNYRIPILCRNALLSGKHVFAEKPPAFNASDVEDVIVAEERSGLILMYGFNHRHHDSIKKIKQVVENKELGKILWMRGRYGKEVNEAFFDGWRAKKELAGGGIMLDQGIHMLDLFMYLGGEFDEIQSIVSNLYWKIDGIEDNVFLNLRSNKTGICASLHSTMTQWRYLFSLEVFLEGGAIILNGLKTTSGAYGDEVLSIKRNPGHTHDGSYDSEERIVYKMNNSWISEVNHFIDCIEFNKKVEIGNSCDALNVMKVIDKIYENNKYSL
ncbi:oxidoreductase domain protein [Chlorobium limicola DSM 245]|uniref:Oxidoreductase domain protein n=1 Tax=Chlorobium limicola (strain DSM 245 / NBRC 103803 / 6330) TaxID=290315 RepID=B3EF61_CHLL2|nr:Gfo/Idh/MocA family oxidoreductase [Chlorobium limicola]ACD90923.1 oxidoreductase domain protein [Chlorobium limicola DSM 245]